MSMVSFAEAFINSLLMLIYTAKQVIGYACIQHPMIGGSHYIDISSFPAFSHPVLLIKIAAFKSKGGISYNSYLLIFNCFFLKSAGIAMAATIMTMPMPSTSPKVVPKRKYDIMTDATGSTVVVMLSWSAER